MVVIVTVVLPDQQSLPAVPRIRNSIDGSFQLKLQNPAGKNLSDYDVHYLVVEAGVYTESTHGINMEAVIVDSSTTAGKGNWGIAPGSFLNTYINPVVVGQVMSENDSDWSVFWASSDSNRTLAPSSGALSLGKHVGEDPRSIRNNETIGYVVAEAGNYFIEGIEFLAGVSADSVKGVGNGLQGFNSPISGVALPETAILSSAAMDGNDGGWPVLFGSDPVSQTEIILAIDEDQINDTERSHTTEQVAYFVLSQFGQTNDPPISAFSVSPLNGQAPLTIVVDANASTDSDGTIVEYAWDFGDGSSGTGVMASHIYQSPGMFSVELAVTDDQGSTDISSNIVNVDGLDQDLAASFTVTHLTGFAPLNVTLEGTSSANGSNVAYHWDFGDGDSGTGQNTSHQYNAVGVYLLELTVSDINGNQGKASETITVLESSGNPISAPSVLTSSGVSMVNPMMIDGMAEPNVEIQVFSNDQLMSVTFADNLGHFTEVVPLNQGTNMVYVIATDGVIESQPSNFISIEYVNTLDVEQGGKIIDSVVVWPARPDGQPYTIFSDSVTISPGGELIILPGADIIIRGGRGIYVDGVIKSIGSDADPIDIRRENILSWHAGIRINDQASEVNIRNTHFGGALYCITVDFFGEKEKFSIQKNVFDGCRNSGVVVSSGEKIKIQDNHFIGGDYGQAIFITGGDANPEIRNNLIESWPIGIINFGLIADQQNLPYGNPEGISTPLIVGNTIRQCDIGVSLRYRTAPTLVGNNISGNQIGMYLNGHDSEAGTLEFAPTVDIEPPLPVINNNSFIDNIDYSQNPPRRRHIFAQNYYRGDDFEIDATNNWWGTSKPADVADQIDHASGTYIYRPYINYLGFLDQEHSTGQIVPGNHVLRIIDDTTLESNTKYTFVERSTTIPATTTLTVESGAFVEFSTPTIGFASNLNRGLYVRGSMVINGTEENPVMFDSETGEANSWSGIDVFDGSLSISNSSFRNASLAIDVSSSSIIRLLGSKFERNGTGLRLNISDDSIVAEVTDSIFTQNHNGIEFGVSAPIPPITVSGNEIYGNSNSGIKMSFFKTASGVPIDGTGNWWGNAPPILGQDLVNIVSAQQEWVDYGNYALAPFGALIPDTYNISNSSFSPDGNTVLDETTIDGCFSGIEDWVLFVKDNQGQSILSFTGISQCFTVTWNGNDDNGNRAIDGQYTVHIGEVGGVEDDLVNLGVIEVSVAPPIIIAPENIVTEAVAEYSNISIGAAQALDSKGNVLGASANNVGPFGVGIHQITWSTVDSLGNSATATQVIEIRDSTPPILILPPDLLQFSDVPLQIDIGNAVAEDIFPVVISNNAPDIYSVGTTTVTWTATDSNGNIAEKTQIIDVSQIEIVTLTPIDGQTTNNENIVLEGSLNAPENSGLIVNGKVAYLDRTQSPTRFSVSIPLALGENKITLVAESLSGLSATSTIHVNREGEPLDTPYDVIGLNTQGLSPLQVEFDISGLETGLVESINYDWDGDGSNDFTYFVPQSPAPEKVIQPYIYDSPGTFHATVTIEEYTGVEFQYQILVQVLDADSLDSMFQNIWNSFNRALLEQDQVGAESYMTGVLKQKYKGVMALLMPQFPNIISSYTGFVPTKYSNSYASYVLNRTIGEEDRLYFVYFLKGKDGVWRMASM